MMLKCDNARMLMSAWLDDYLEEDGKRALRDHVLTCADCRMRWHAMRHVSSLFQSAETALPPPDFTARVMRRVQTANAQSRPARFMLPSRSLAWGTVAATVVLLFALIVSYGTAPAQQVADGGPSLNFVSLSMQISNSALRAATAVGGVINIASDLGRIVPRPALALMVLWLVFGTIALSFTVAGLIAAYQPLSSVASSESEANS
jgi:hypothetical protein